MNEEKIDKILLTVLDNQGKLQNVDDRVGRLERIVENTFNKLDGFVNTIGNHEAEIAALRSAVSRLEQRLDQLQRT